MRTALSLAVAGFLAAALNGLYWRLHGPRVRGRIVRSGARENGRLARLRQAGL